MRNRKDNNLIINNKFSELEREIIIGNIIKRLNRLDTFNKDYLASKYAKSSFFTLIKRIKALEVNIEDIEKDLKYISDNSSKGLLVRDNSARSLRLANTEREKLTTDSKSTSEHVTRRPQSSQGQRSINKAARINSSTAYIEPVNFETFLRDAKRPVIVKDRSKGKSSTNKTTIDHTRSYKHI